MIKVSKKKKVFIKKTLIQTHAGYISLLYTVFMHKISVVNVILQSNIPKNIVLIEM